MMKLFVDDVRPAPEGDEWLVARTVKDAKTYLQRDDIVSVSLDHDMGACDECIAKGEHIGEGYVNWCQHAEDGYALVMWMIENRRIPPLVWVHSMNPVGKRRMIAALESRPR